MLNLEWLAVEAHKLHGIFETAFFTMLAAFLVLAVVLEFLKIPVGEASGFMTLLGRALIATFFLVALPEVMNVVGDVTDSIAREIGDLNQFKLVLSRMGEKLRDLSFSWTSVKDMVILIVSFLSFFILYVTVYFADAAFLYCWTLIYVFSPLVFALYVFPSTAGATKSLFRSMLEVSLWKIVWASMAALLWSTALSDLNKSEYHIDFLTALVLNLMLALSVLITPFIVRSLLQTGAHQAATSMQSLLMAGAALTPAAVVAKPKALASYIGSKVIGQGKGPDDRGSKRKFLGSKTPLKPRETKSRPGNSTQPGGKK